MLASSLIVKRDKEPVAARWRVIRFLLIIDFSDRDPNRKVQMLAASAMHTRVWTEVGSMVNGDRGDDWIRNYHRVLVNASNTKTAIRFSLNDYVVRALVPYPSA